MMQTACPTCATVFRITPEQLKARQGQVRCGQCAHVFNALESLVDAPSIAAAQAVIQPPTDTPAATDAATERAATPAVADTAEATEHTSAPDESETSDAPSSSGDIATTPTIPAQNASPLPVQEEYSYAPSAEPPARVWPWFCAALLALLVLFGQAALQFRTEIATLLPEIKPSLQAAVELLDYDLPLPHKPDLLSIETSDLHPEPQHPGMLILAATLKNRAPFAMAYPHLELTLTDTLDQPILRKVITPADYLPKGVSSTPGFPAGSDLALNFALTPGSHEKAASTSASAGYRLYLFYP